MHKRTGDQGHRSEEEAGLFILLSFLCPCVLATPADIAHSSASAEDIDLCHHDVMCWSHSFGAKRPLLPPGLWGVAVPGYSQEPETLWGLSPQAELGDLVPQPCLLPRASGTVR